MRGRLESDPVRSSRGLMLRPLMLLLITPLKLRLNFDTESMRKHSAYKYKILFK